MKIYKIADRYNGEVGVERVNRDGKIEVLRPSDAEPTVQDRTKWYEKGKVDARGNNPDEMGFEIDRDDGGNPMELKDLSHRTSMPRPHQYSIERRLRELEDPGSTESITSDASLAEAMAMTFKEVVKEVKVASNVSNEKIIAMSDSSGLRVRDVVSLIRVAGKRPDLVEKYAEVPGETTNDYTQDKSKKKDKCCKGPKENKPKDLIPGTTFIPNAEKGKKVRPGVKPTSEKYTEEEMAVFESSKEVGLT
jgi:hypothetical protein